MRRIAAALVLLVACGPRPKADDGEVVDAARGGADAAVSDVDADTTTVVFD